MKAKPPPPLPRPGLSQAGPDRSQIGLISSVKLNIFRWTLNPFIHNEKGKNIAKFICSITVILVKLFFGKRLRTNKKLH